MKNWEKRRLADVVEFHRGLTYSKSDEVEISNNVVLRSNNIDLVSNKLDFTELKYINSNVSIPDSKKVKKGTLLICTANGSKSHLGKVALIDDNYEFAFGGFMGLIKPKKEISPEYLFHILTSEKYKKYISSLSDGANINNLKFGDLGEFEIPVPPLNEQKHIVTILDKAFAAIDKAKANTEKNLQNVRELFESYLEDIFYGKNWDNTSLRDETELLVGFAFKSKGYTDEKSDVLLVRGDNIMQGYFRWDDAKRWRKSELNEYSKFQLQENDIVLAMDRPWVKAGLKVARISKSELPALLVQRTACLRTKNGLNNTFLFYLLNSKLFMQYLVNAQTGIGVPHISGNQIMDFEFQKPSIKEQQDHVDNIDALRAESTKLETLYQQKIANLEELKKTILKKAFTGDL